MTVSSDMMRRMCFNAMATGALMSFLYRTKEKIVRPLFHPLVQVLTVVTLLVCWVSNYEFRLFNDEIYAIFFAIIILNLAMNPKTLISFDNRVLEYLGKISYGLYVYHLVVIFLVLRYCYYFDNPALKNIMTMAYALLGTILVSSASYEFFEKPFLRLKEKRFSIIRSGQKMIDN
jgi:peptidoglycan/LPS O-acetylase OafA/YrhL